MTDFAKRGTLAGLIAAAFLLATPVQADDSAYSIAVENGKAKVGEAGAIKVIVTVRNGWRINYRYPHTISKLDGGKGVDIALSSVRGQLGGSTITWTIGAVPTTSGDHKVAGEMDFSLSKAGKKLNEKRPVEATITGE